MTFRPNKADIVAEELIEVSLDLKELLAEGLGPEDADALEAISQTLHEKAEDVNSVAVDVRAMQQIGRIGVENFPDRNLAPAVVEIQLLRRRRAQSRSLARQQPSRLEARFNGRG